MKIFQVSIFGAIVFASAFAVQAQDYRGKAVANMQRDFHTRGIAHKDRLDEDVLQNICNRSDNKPPKAMAETLQNDQLRDIEYPADGKFLGDWKSGEKIAQRGRGMTWSDKLAKTSRGEPNGGSCYNCHQIGPKETSFGTIGNSLFHFGKIRGYGPDTQKYVYGKIYNAKAFNLCSKMPRFGHSETLTEEEIKDLVALLLDPKSPVNQ
ncbi:MAG: sulfur oxidation c-type cytochrome SoxX [Betaproteobacteria bacterium]|nr:MAG: sulfur oxidation c-type cytochrome SoxX [Betaproteobacteria bacterium]